MSRIEASYASVRGGRPAALRQAAALAASRGWSAIGIEPRDDRVLWVVGESSITFYYQQEEA